MRHTISSIQESFVGAYTPSIGGTQHRCILKCIEVLRCASGAGLGGAVLSMRGLTLELSGRQQRDARPRLAKMCRVPPNRAWWPAVGAPLERRASRHLLPVILVTQPLSSSARTLALKMRVRTSPKSILWDIANLNSSESRRAL